MSRKSINMIIIKGPINETFDIHNETKILYEKIKRILSNKDDKFRIIALISSVLLSNLVSNLPTITCSSPIAFVLFNCFIIGVSRLPL